MRKRRHYNQYGIFRERWKEMSPRSRFVAIQRHYARHIPIPPDISYMTCAKTGLTGSEGEGAKRFFN